jgi:ATP-dependent DNA helicase RecG
MNKAKLRDLIRAGDIAQIEYVQSIKNSIDRVSASVCAFLNCGGGLVVIGASRNGGDIETTTEDYSNGVVFPFERRLRHKLSPPAPFFVRKLRSAGRCALVIEVPPGSTPPYSSKNVIYKRVGERIVPASMSDVRESVMRSQEGLERWENRFALPSVDECISESDVTRAIEEMGRCARVDLAPGLSLNKTLSVLGLVRYSRLLNAGVIMSGKKPGGWFPQARIRVANYSHSKSDNEVLDGAIYDSPLCESIEAAVEFISRNTRHSLVFAPNSLTRMEMPEFPPMAVREALVNACVHREYESAFGGVSVSLYPDRLEIWNSGSLPDGVDVNALNKGLGQRSILRNPTLSNAMYLRGYMEQIGRGSELIPEACKKIGLPLPEWSSSREGGVKIVFWRRKVDNGIVSINYDTETTSNAGPVNGPVNGPVKGPVKGRVFWNEGGLAGKLDLQSISPAVLKVLECIENQPGCRQNGLAQQTGISERRVKRYIAELKKKNLVEFRGAPKNGGYWVVDRGRS